jgi:hypothetical protein
MTWWDVCKILLTAGLAALFSGLAFWFKFLPEFRTTKRAEFLEKQLAELYGPLKVMIRKVRILSEARVHEMNVFTKYARIDVPEHDRQHAELLEKHNQELRSVIIPTYEKMETLLSTKTHLAEPDIFGGLDAFFRFVKVWKDHLEKPIGQRFPSTAAAEIAEQNKEPREFFELIERQFQQKLTVYREMFSSR